MPGILTGIAAVVGAITALLGATGYLTPHNISEPPPVTSPNHAPVADVGSSITVEEGKTDIPLNGRGIDPDGDILTYLWREIGGDPLVSLVNENKAIAKFNAPINLTDDTKLIFEFTVQDRKGLTDSDDVLVTVLNNKSNDVELLNNKGWNLYKLDRNEEAIGYYDRALAIDPNNYIALDIKGIALDALGRYNEAIGYYDRALAIDPNDPVILTNKGISLANFGNYTNAIQYYNKALEIDPNFELAKNNRNYALDQLNKTNTSVIQR